MRDLEQQTMDAFIKWAGKRTITEYGKISGIERTRFFRLLHGADMKVKEFIRLQQFIKKKNGKSVDWAQVLGDMDLEKNLGVDLAGASDGLLLFERTKRLESIMKSSELAA